MYVRETESNYHTAEPNLNVTGNGVSQSSGGAYMSVAAKAGEMQIFSSDILSQVNGLTRRHSQKHAISQGGKKFSSKNTADNRFSHINEQMSNVEEKMLQIDSTSMKAPLPS